MAGSARPLRIRLLVAEDGAVRAETSAADVRHDSAPVRLGLAADPVDSEDPFLHFKTTHRAAYDRARASRPECDDVVLWNAEGQVTETTVANLVVRVGGELVTPPTRCGLLAGTLRAEMLERGEIRERVVTVGELAGADGIFLANSVRGLREAVWVEPRLETASLSVGV